MTDNGLILFETVLGCLIWLDIHSRITCQRNMISNNALPLNVPFSDLGVNNLKRIINKF